MYRISYQDFENLLSNRKNKLDNNIIIEPTELTARIQNKRITEKEILLIRDKDLKFTGKNNVFYFEFLRQFIPSKKSLIKELNDLTEYVNKLTARHYDFDYKDDLTQEILDRVYDLLNYFLKDKFVIFDFSTVHKLDRISWVIASKLVHEKCSFEFMYIFDYSYNFKSNKKQSDKRLLVYTANLMSLIRLCLAIKMWSSAKKLIKYMFTFIHKIKNLKILSEFYFRAGMLYMRKGNIDKSKQYYIKSKKYAKKINNDIHLLKVLNNLGNIHIDLMDYTNAKKCFRESMKLAEKYRKDYSLSVIYSSLGNVYIRTGEYKEAIEYLNKALLMAARSGLAYRIQLIYIFLGDAYKKIEKYKKAIGYYKKALKCSQLEEMLYDQGFIYMRMGKYYYDIDDNKKAKENFKLSEKIFKQSDNEYGIMLINELWGYYYKRVGNKKNAVKHFEKSLELSKKFKHLNFEEKIKKNLNEK